MDDAMVRLEDGTTYYSDNSVSLMKHLLRNVAGFYDPEPIQIQNRWTVIDVGAYLGTFSIYAAAKGAAVTAVEAADTSFKYLARNLRYNDFENLPIKVVKGALIDSDREVELYAAKATGWPSPVQESERFAPTMYPGIGINTFLKDYDRVDFLKMNCEGSEGLIFPAMTKESWAKIQRISMQFHPKWSPVDGETLFNMIHDHGFTMKITGKSPADDSWWYAWR